MMHTIKDKSNVLATPRVITLAMQKNKKALYCKALWELHKFYAVGGNSEKNLPKTFINALFINSKKVSPNGIFG